jgi:choline dehydrogenase
MVSAEVTVKTYDAMRSGVRRIGAGVRWLCDREGPATSPANHLQAFVKTDASLPCADIQVQTAAVSSFQPSANSVQGVTSVISLCRPQARGRVVLRSGDPMAAPVIATDLLSVEADRKVLLAGSRLVRDVLRAGPGATFGAGELAPGANVDTDQQWLAYLRRTAGLNWHPTSTCRMGSGPDDVVDTHLRVHGIAGLRVADASIMPTLTSGNTNAVAIMIGEMAAKIIQENSRGLDDRASTIDSSRQGAGPASVV